MRIIQHISELPDRCKKKSSILTIGVFDGVHIAHQAILRQVVSHASTYPDGQSMVYSFDDHPLKVLQPENAPSLLIPTDEKNKLIAKWGIDILINAKFTIELSQTPAEKFIRNVISKYIDLKEIIVGHDHGFGKGGKGNVRLLREVGKDMGFQVFELSPIQIDQKTISSSYIRELLLTGEVAKARKMLDRLHSITGKVIQGYHRGQHLGYPTANLSTKHEVIPGKGVYAVWVEFNNEKYPGIMNIGDRPTFPDSGSSVEVHLLGFNGNIYGKELKISFLEKIRDEQKFISVDELKKQLHRDKMRVKTIFHLKESCAS